MFYNKLHYKKKIFIQLRLYWYTLETFLFHFRCNGFACFGFCFGVFLPLLLQSYCHLTKKVQNAKLQFWHHFSQSYTNSILQNQSEWGLQPVTCLLDLNHTVDQDLNHHYDRLIRHHFCTTAYIRCFSEMRHANFEVGICLQVYNTKTNFASESATFA